MQAIDDQPDRTSATGCPTTSDGTSILAGIVVYFPDAAHLSRLIGSIAPEVGEIVVYANSPIDAQAEARLVSDAAPTPLHVVRPDGNDGLGTAYNALAVRAAAGDHALLFLLDQDSLPASGTIRHLSDVFHALRAEGERPAVVGPRPLDSEGTPMKVATRAAGGPRRAPARPTGFVISSGSLIDCVAARDIGPFRTDYFIDAIDIEWCMRARARGYSVWIADEAWMEHELGQGIIRLPFGMLMTKQPPRRLYTYIRNQLAMLRLAHVPVPHKAKMLLSLPLRIAIYLVHDRFGRETRTAIWRGLADGACGRLGPPVNRLL